MNKKVTLLFPGQGSQYVGMGKNLAAFFKRADEVLGYSLSNICFEGPEEELKLTKNTQPAILTHSFALLDWAQKILQKNNVSIERVLGHSVGEYGALVAAGVFSFEDAVKAVHLRGRYMQEAVPAGKGKMFAILRTSEEWVRKACQESSSPSTGDVVTPANFNDPEQVVIAGTKEACERAVAWLGQHCPQKFRAIELPVSAPFHCPLMDPAAEKLAVDLKKISFHSPQIPYIANLDAKEYGVHTDPEIIRRNLIGQVAGSVLWLQSVQLIPSGSVCLEVGPGKVLKGLLRKINPELKVVCLDSETAEQELTEALS